MVFDLILSYKLLRYYIYKKTVSYTFFNFYNLTLIELFLIANYMNTVRKNMILIYV